MTQKINSPADLKAIREQALAGLSLRGGAKDMRLIVHTGTCGIAAGARDVLTQLMSDLAANDVQHVTLTQAGCAGLCDQEPMITISTQGGETFRYGKLDKNKVRRIVQEHVVRGNPVVEFLIQS